MSDQLHRRPLLNGWLRRPGAANLNFIIRLVTLITEKGVVNMDMDTRARLEELPSQRKRLNRFEARKLLEREIYAQGLLPSSRRGERLLKLFNQFWDDASARGYTQGWKNCELSMQGDLFTDFLNKIDSTRGS